ncbi:COG4705 family protein [Lacrimispora sp.]|uniref:COG4705 family protein n=1 Tax=Lacrimispora sp. TaxID=2719234 RepID=UPI0028B0D484|nr:hypothetical protein [Lacrimispora sp.]
MNEKTKSMISKVPAVTIFFWIIKVLCTTVGETASDFLNVNLGLGLVGTSIFMGTLFLIVLFLQFRTTKYTPSIYWPTVVLISVFGTLVTDNLTDGMGVPLEFSTILFSVCLALTFAAWYYSEKDLSIHSIYTMRREAFYWLAILFTFALGTASGDLMAEGLGLGYLTTGLIICACIICVAIAWRAGLDPVLSFWMIYIMTRPLGASLGDFLSQSKANGGLGLGATFTSVIFLAAILATVVFLTITKKDLSQEGAQPQTEPKRHRAMLQTVVIVGFIIILSGTGYSIRHTSLVNSQSDPWADLSSFRTIEEDVLMLVEKGDLVGGKSRVKDLEIAWDNAAASMKAADQGRWKEADTGIDAVLSELRASNPDAGACKSALHESLTQLK